MARVLILLILLVLPATGTQAGPWPRAQGESFVAPMAGRGNRIGAIREIYAEHGLTRRLTLGVDMARRGQRTDIELFGRWHLRDLGESRPVSASLGLVSLDEPDRGAARLRLKPGLHLGYGFTRPGYGGWARLSLSALQAPHGAGTHLDLYAQLGLRATPGTLFAIGLGAYNTPDSTYLTLMPTAGWRVGSRTTLVAEGGFGLDRHSKGEVDVTLGFWYRF